jgi:hypothetical protein
MRAGKAAPSMSDESHARLGHPYRLEDGVWWFGYKHARDIPDELFLDAVRVARGRNGVPQWATRWDVEAVLGGVTFPRDFTAYPDVPGVPEKVVLAKAKRLIARKLLDGCPCGCRGDFEIPEERP